MDQFDTADFMSHLKTKYIGQQFTYLDSTGSTMDDAKYAAHQVNEKLVIMHYILTCMPSFTV